MKKFFNEFKKFISRGNVVDLAVGVVVGSAFTAIVNNIVNGIIMPLISIITGGNSVGDWKWIIKEAIYNPDGTLAKAEVSFKFGAVIQSVIDFLIIAFVIFLLVKAINLAREAAEKEARKLADAAQKHLKKGEKEAENKKTEGKPVVEISSEEKLLTEIRDLLKKEKELKK